MIGLLRFHVFFKKGKRPYNNDTLQLANILLKHPHALIY